jgi:hypothetical protein
LLQELFYCKMAILLRIGRGTEYKCFFIVHGFIVSIKKAGQCRL